MPLYSRGHVRNYDQWYRITNDTTWKWSNVLPYYMKSENVTDEKLVNKGSYGTKGPVKVSRDRHAITKEYLQAFKQAGKRLTTGSDGNKLGYFQGVITTYMGRRQAGASSYLTRVKNNRYLKIAKHSLATKILFDDRKNAVTVEVINDKNQTVTVKATKEIIVTDGAVKSAQLLFLSGIGPKAHLDKMKIKVIVDSPQVGKNLQDHTAAILFHRTNKLLHARPKHCGPRDYISPLLVGYVTLNKSCGYPDYQAMDFVVTDSGLKEQLCKMLTTLNAQICPWLLNLTRNREVLLSLISNVDMISRGQITLRSANPKDQPRIESRVYSEDEDLEGMIDYVIDYVKVEGIDYFRKIGATMVDPSLKCNKYKKGSRAYWRYYSLCIMSSMGHYSGTCAMGPVLDSRLYVRGVRRIRVADASMMPTLVCGNPQQPIMAVAKKVSDWLIKDQ